MLKFLINFIHSRHRRPLALLLPLIYIACVPQIRETERGPGPEIRVLLATIDTRDTISFRGSYILQSEEAQYEFGQRNSDLTIQPLPDGLQLYNQNRNLLYRNAFPVILLPQQTDSRFRYHGREYAGAVYFQPAPGSGLYLINKLLLEEYLKGVVPAEIPANKEEDFEAIKAQAICARTYALRHLEDNRAKLYDVQSTVSDQVYAGFDRHTRLADQAIGETAGVIISYQGQPATVYYHSTCGGKLASAKNIFSGNDLPYLPGGTDAVGNTFSCSISPYFRWEQRRTFEELDDAFFKFYSKRRLGESVEDTLQLTCHLQITGRDSSGRVSGLSIDYADTTVVLNGYQIRRFLAPPGTTYLPSNLFYLSQSGDSTLVIHGAGYGHGVGLCQFGALFMSQRGFKHYHILSKYFPQTKLLRKY
jgi:stage II sporulation protein D